MNFDGYFMQLKNAQYIGKVYCAKLSIIIYRINSLNCHATLKHIKERFTTL
jgi:hypothetical protein